MKGGVRKGAGRKRGPETVLMNFLIERAIADKLRAEVGPGEMTAFVQCAIKRALSDRSRTVP
jgi:hypothetical protein